MRPQVLRWAAAGLALLLLAGCGVVRPNGPGRRDAGANAAVAAASDPTPAEPLATATAPRTAPAVSAPDSAPPPATTAPTTAIPDSTPPLATAAPAAGSPEPAGPGAALPLEPVPASAPPPEPPPAAAAAADDVLAFATVPAAEPFWRVQLPSNRFIYPLHWTDGVVYLTAGGGGPLTLNVLDRDGRLRLQRSYPALAGHCCEVPLRVSLAPDGTLVITDLGHKAEVYDAGGRLVTQFTTPRMEMQAVWTNGGRDLLLHDTYWLTRAYLYTPAGVQKADLLPPPLLLEGGRIAVDAPTGWIAVVDEQAARLFKDGTEVWRGDMEKRPKTARVTAGGEVWLFWSTGDQRQVRWMGPYGSRSFHFPARAQRLSAAVAPDTGSAWVAFKHSGGGYELVLLDRLARPLRRWQSPGHRLDILGTSRDGELAMVRACPPTGSCRGDVYLVDRFGQVRWRHPSSTDAPVLLSADGERLFLVHEDELLGFDLTAVASPGD